MGCRRINEVASAMSDDKYKPPSESIGDHAHTLARAGLSMVPVLGDPAVELFQAVIAPPLKRRQQKWMEAVAVGLGELERKQKCVVDELRDNEGFIDTVLQASQAAIRTSQQEKIEALRNAVLNSALPSRPDENRRQIFLSLVDSFSALHLRLLAFLDDPEAWYRINGRSPPPNPLETILALVLHAFPDLKEQAEVCDQASKELYGRGLIRPTSLRDDVSRHRMFNTKPRMPEGFGGHGLPGIGPVVEIPELFN